MFFSLLEDPTYRALCLRAADYDPVSARMIEQTCTLTEIAEALMLRAHDHHVES